MNTNAHAQWVSDLMAADGIKPEQVTPDLALAYLEIVGRKIQQIQTGYLTKIGAKEAMQTTVFGLLSHNA
jgi:hypothetical protein